MLAQNFRTAEELGLTEKGYAGLHKVLRMLEGGELVYTRVPNVPNGFNMNSCWEQNECGTVGCIGGWAGFYDKKGFVEEMLLPTTPNTRLGPLFCPPDRYSKHYSVEQAAHALRTYLVTGQADWQ